MAKQDWTGNTNSIFKTLGSSHHTEEEREENDYYATDPRAIDLLLDKHKFSEEIWEPACGQGHLSKRMIEHGHLVKSTDLIDRGFGDRHNFLTSKASWGGDIITNPPYKFAKDFVQKAISILQPGRQLAMFLKIQFLEGKGRREMFNSTPPKLVLISSSRINCAKNGNFTLRDSGGSAIAYAWFIWEKGYTGDTVLKWIN